MQIIISRSNRKRNRQRTTTTNESKQTIWKRAFTKKETNQTMSSQGQGSNPPGQKSPGKGGKSLQLMQQRMQAHSQEQQQPPPQQIEEQQQPQQQSHVQVPQQQQQPTSQSASASQTSPSSRPKGKDFAAMSARNHRPSESEPALEAAAPNQTAPQGSRPKGKDFSALSNRMGNQQPQPMTQEQQQLRAAQMQNAARAAAGLPPLVHPTATSVTTTPPNIPTPRNLGQSNVNLATSSSSLTSRMHATVNAGPANVSQPSSSGYYHQQQQQQVQPMQRPQQQVMQRQPQVQQPSQAPARSHSNINVSNAVGTAARAPVPAPAAQAALISSYHQPRPTLQRPAVQSKGEPSLPPKIEESHLSMSGPHVVPAVGERIQTLLNSIDPNYTLDSAAEAQVLQLANDFLTKVTQQSFELAQHRGSPALDVQDVQWVLAKQWGIVIPGLGPPPTRSLNPSTSSSVKRKRRASGSITGSAAKAKTSSAKTQAVSAAAK